MSTSANTNQLQQNQNPSGEEQKPFQFEKDITTCISIQQQELILIAKYFKEIVPKLFKSNREYGEKLLNNAEKLKPLLGGNSALNQDLHQIVLLLSQFYQLQGKLFQQDFQEIQEEVQKQYLEPLSLVLSEIKKQNPLADSQKTLMKAQTSFIIADRIKIECQKATSEALDAIQKEKQAKEDPELQYNVTVLEQLNEKSQKSIKVMEEKKEQYQSAYQNFEQINEEFTKFFDLLTNNHELLLNNSTFAIKKGLETCVNQEILHFESLNILTPEKSNVIKKYQIKLDLINNDCKLAQEKGWKINILQTKQKIQELGEGALTFQSLYPYSVIIQDSLEFYSKLTEQHIKFYSSIFSFCNEIVNLQRNMQKFYNGLSTNYKKSKEQIQAQVTQGGQTQIASTSLSSCFQLILNEIIKINDQKERNHQNFNRYMEGLVLKMEQNLKQLKQDEKIFNSNMSKFVKEVNNQNEKTNKSTQNLQKQSELISQQMATNYQTSFEERQNSKLSSLMQEYKTVNEQIKELSLNYKNFLISQMDNAFENIKSYKEQITNHLKQVYGVVCGLASYEETFIYQMYQLAQDHQKFVVGFNKEQILQNYKMTIKGNNIQTHQYEKAADIALSENDSEQQQPSNDDTFELKIEINKDNVALNLANGESQQVDILQNLNQSSQNSKSQINSPKRKLSNENINERQQTTIKQQFNESPNQIKDQKLIFSMAKSRADSSHSEQNESPFQRSSEKKEPKHAYSMGQKTNMQFQIGSMKDKLKKQLSLTNDFITEEELKNIENAKQKLQLPVTPNEDISNPSTPNSKFIIEKFNNLEEGEKVMETYACALSQKILLQGRLYVTTKKLCFYSFFNDKTIVFGKETKFMIPFKNILKLEKKYNAMVFDNSIAVITKDEKEIFFTSFVYRDQAFDVMQNLIDQCNGVVKSPPDDQQLKEEIKNEEQLKNQEQEEEKQIESQVIQSNNNEQINEIQEEIKEEIEVKKQEFNEEEVMKLYNNSFPNITEEFQQVEQERLNKIKEQIKDYDNFPWLMFDKTVDCSLKEFAQVYLDIGIKLPQCKNFSLFEHLSMTALHNKDIKINKGVDLLPYFKNPDSVPPSPQEFKNWPINPTLHDHSLIHVAPNPKFMQPKQNGSTEKYEIYYVSPRMIVRKNQITGEGFQYSDTFNIEGKMIMTEILDSDQKAKTKISYAFRINILKTVRLIQGIIVKETEKSLRAGHEEDYINLLSQRVLETKDYMKQLYLNQKREEFELNQQKQDLQPQKVNQKEIIKISIIQEQKQQQQQQQLQPQQQLQQVQVQEQQQQLQIQLKEEEKINKSQVQRPIKSQEEENEKLNQILAEILALKQEVSKLHQFIMIILAMSAFIILMLIFWR